MREALHIFRKDVRHLWPGILLVLAVTALEGWLNTAALNPLQSAVGLLWALSCMYLGASVIYEERLPGHEQYWLTRPYCWRRLLLAKMLFLVVFLALPQLVSQSIALAANGVSPLAHLTGLLCTSLFFGTGVGLAVAALAAVTGNLLQFMWAILPLATVEFLSLILADPGKWRWGNVEWIRDSAIAAAVLAAAAIILILQYSRRKTIWSRGVLAVTILLVSAAPFLGNWHMAFAIQTGLHKRTDPSGIRISFESAGRRLSGYGIGAFSPTRQEEGIAIPILVTGIPAGVQIIGERIAAAIEAPGGRSWRSAWTATGGLAGVNPLEDSRLIRADGPSWQYLNVDRSFYRAVKDTPVEIHTSVALTLLGDPQSAPLAAQGRTRDLPRGGLCYVGQGLRSNLIVSCTWPMRAPARAYVAARSVQTGQALESLLTPAGSYSPYPTSGSVWDQAAAMFSAPPEPLELKLETWQALAHFERDLDIPAIRLSDYVVRRITDPN